MANINKELNQIKNAVYGREVRDAIHDGIEKAYNDATSGGAGDTDLEVVLARGKYDALNKRLDASDSQLAEKATQSDVNKKRDKSVPITLNDADQEMLEAIQEGDGASFDILSIPRNDSVEFSKMSNSLFSLLNNDKLNGVNVGDWEHGAINRDTGEPFEPANVTRIRTKNHIPVKKGTVIKLLSKESHKFGVYIYTKEKEWEGNYDGFEPTPSDDHTIEKNCYIKIVVAYKDDREIDEDNITDLARIVEIDPDQDKKTHINNITKDAINFMQNKPFKLNYKNLWEHGAINQDTGDVFTPQNPTRIRMRDFLLIEKETKIKPLSNEVKISVYVYNIDNKEYQYKSGLSNDVTTISERSYVKIIIAYENDKEIKGEDFLTLTNLCEIIPSQTNDNHKKYYFVEDFRGLFFADNVTSFSDGRNVQTNEIYDKYNELIDTNLDYVERELIKVDDEDNEIYKYSYIPMKLDSDQNFDNLKIVITTGVHGNEKGSVFSTYNFFEQLCNNWKSNEILEFIRHNIEFDVIPVVNPSGFNNHTRINSNGVDINREFPNNGISSFDDYSDKEPEAQAVLELIESVKSDVDLWIDFHNMNFRDGYVAYATGKNQKVNEVMNRTINKMGREWQKEYNLFPQEENHEFGYTIDGARNTITSCVNESGIRGMTLEIIRETQWKEDWETYDSLTTKLGLELLVNSCVNVIKNINK